jgi:Spy/CpxP family protein refolding chaperone
MKTFLLCVAIAVCLMPCALLAQPLHTPGQRPAMERVESLKKVRMVESLKLDENQSMKLIARYNKHRETIHSFERESGTLFDKLEAQIEADASDGEFNQTLAALMDIEKRKFEARTKFIDELREVLTPKQIAQYVVFERNFARDLRDAVRDVRLERLKKQ